MKHLYVLVSWPEDMDMLWIKFLSFDSVFCSANISCSMIVHIFKLQRQTLSGGGHKFSEFACSLHNCTCTFAPNEDPFEILHKGDFIWLCTVCKDRDNLHEQKYINLKYF